MFPYLLISLGQGIDPILKIIVYFVLFFFIFFWLSIVVWTINDVMNRSKNLLFQCFAVVLVMAFNVPGLIVYIIFRPQKTLEDVNFERLEKKLLLNSLENQEICPNCEKVIEGEHLFCPYCQAKVKKECKHCHKLIEETYKYCPYCSSAVTAKSPKRHSILKKTKDN